MFSNCNVFLRVERKLYMVLDTVFEKNILLLDMWTSEWEEGWKNIVFIGNSNFSPSVVSIL